MCSLPRKKYLVYAFIALAILWTEPSALAASNTFSQAPFITTREFLSELKAVSLILRTDSKLANFMSQEEQRAHVAALLAKIDIVINPDAPVAMVVNVDVGEASLTASSQYTLSGTVSKPIYTFSTGVRFYVRGGTVRKGKLHSLIAAAGSSDQFNSWIGLDDSTKSVLGDNTRERMQSSFDRGVGESLVAIGSSTTGESGAWPVSSWTSAQKASADTQFAKMMQPGSPSDKSPFEGIDSSPELTLNPDSNHPRCVADADWRRYWSSGLQRLGWVERRDNSLEVNHYFFCHHDGSTYFMLYDDVVLIEPDFVFELNGRFVRKRVSLYSSAHSALAVANDLDTRLAGYLEQSVTDSLADFLLGTSSAPAIAVSASSPAPPVTGSRSAPVRPADQPPPGAPRTKPIMVGKVDVSHFAGLKRGDTREQVISLYGPPSAENTFEWWGSSKGFMVDYVDDKVDIVEAQDTELSLVRAKAGSDALLDLIGKKESEAVAALGPPVDEESDTARVYLLYWTFPMDGVPARATANRASNQTVILKFRRATPARSANYRQDDALCISAGVTW